MDRIFRFKDAVAVTLALLLTTFTTSTGANQNSIPRQNPSQQDYGKLVVDPGDPYAGATAILWQDPVDLECRDLFYGPGGPAGAPDPSQDFIYVKRVKTGTQKKIVVKDNRDHEWSVKFGPEARPETVATRIVWAVGYHVDQDYFVPRAHIVGEKSYNACDVRFERKDDGYKDIGNWSWEDNPFQGTPELEGLKVVMALLKNWDLKESNNKILVRKKAPGPQIYYVSDLGATLGRSGSIFNKLPLFGDMPVNLSFEPGKAKGNPYGYDDEGFIKEVRDGRVFFDLRRSHSRHRVNCVPVACARWMGSLLGRLSDKQLTDAFCAGGYDRDEIAIYVTVLRSRIRALQSL